MEDILELWQAIVQNATECTPELLNLFPSLLNLFDFGTVLLTVLKIVKSYILLDPHALFQVNNTNNNIYLYIIFFIAYYKYNVVIYNSFND